MIGYFCVMYDVDVLYTLGIGPGLWSVPEGIILLFNANLVIGL